MAGSSRLHDSRLSLVRVHIPLPAVRPRQRSWGTSLPQSVILIRLFRIGYCGGTGPCSGGAYPYPKERRAQRRNGLRFWSSGSCPTVLVRCKPRPTFGDFPARLTLVVCRHRTGSQSARCLPRYILGDCYELPSSSLAKRLPAISLQTTPTNSPFSGGGPGFRSRPGWITR